RRQRQRRRLMSGGSCMNPVPPLPLAGEGRGEGNLTKSFPHPTLSRKREGGKRTPSPASGGGGKRTTPPANVRGESGRPFPQAGVGKSERPQPRSGIEESCQPCRSTISFLTSAIAFAGLSPFGHVRAQFMIVWQR